MSSTPVLALAAVPSEHAVLGAEDQLRLIAALRSTGGFTEAVVLSARDAVEVYGVGLGYGHHLANRLLRTLAAYCATTPDALRPVASCLSGRQAAEHLIRTAEPGRLRDARWAAERASGIGPVLGSLFAAGSRTARVVRGAPDPERIVRTQVDAWLHETEYGAAGQLITAMHAEVFALCLAELDRFATDLEPADRSRVARAIAGRLLSQPMAVARSAARTGDFATLDLLARLLGPQARAAAPVLG